MRILGLRNGVYTGFALILKIIWYFENMKTAILRMAQIRHAFLFSKLSYSQNYPEF
jgi:hypothetical protein